jgi:hypothetical protein
VFFVSNKVELWIQQELGFSHASYCDPKQVTIHQSMAKNKSRHKDLLTQISWTCSSGECNKQEHYQNRQKE